MNFILCAIALLTLCLLGARPSAAYWGAAAPAEAAALAGGGLVVTEQGVKHLQPENEGARQEQPPQPLQEPQQHAEIEPLNPGTTEEQQMINSYERIETAPGLLPEGEVTNAIPLDEEHEERWVETPVGDAADHTIAKCNVKRYITVAVAAVACACSAAGVLRCGGGADGRGQQPTPLIQQQQQQQHLYPEPQSVTPASARTTVFNPFEDDEPSTWPAALALDEGASAGLPLLANDRGYFAERTIREWAEEARAQAEQGDL